MINRDKLDYLFNIAKQVKKPLVAIYPNGTIIGTDEQFTGLNIMESEFINYDIQTEYIFDMKELNAFMKNIKSFGDVFFTPYEIYLQENPNISVMNHIELYSKFMILYNKALNLQNNTIINIYENFQNYIPEMFSMKVSQGAKMYHIDKYLMTSFNAIHPVNKSDRVDLILRDHDMYSYTAEFIIYKKKEKYQLHEFLRFGKI